MPSWSPDGREIAYVVCESTVNSSPLTVFNLQTRTKKDAATRIKYRG